MILKNVKVTNFKSIRETCQLATDSRITTLLGANDHGKSNLLQAIFHLNYNKPFTEDELNWDTPTWEVKGSPSVIAEFALTNPERQKLTEIIKPIIKTQPQQENIDRAKAQVAQGDSQEKEQGSIPGDQGIEAEQLKSPYDSLLGSTIRVAKTGIPGVMYLNDLPLADMPPPIQEWLKDTQPRFELFSQFSSEIQDQADATSIGAETAEFIQGIFFQAGLEQKDWKTLFSQTDLTMKRLDDASEVLNTNLSGMWGQGRNLQFKLRHQGNTIQLVVNDPAIGNRYVRLSKKSTGVTHFFRLSMTLHARRKKEPANSYIYLFDEPGVYLHPLGQRNLLQAFELLTESTQIIFATHSLFLLNANFPERHRLIIMDDQGTTIDHKPYRASWRLATDALGVRLGSMALFSDCTVLTEGESDPLYLYELIRILNLLGDTDADSNQLGVMSFTNLQTLKYLIQMLTADDYRPQLTVLLDGDKNGKLIAERIKTLCETKKVSIIFVPDGFSIENLCFFPDVFQESLIETIQAACEAENTPIPAELAQKVKAELTSYRQPRTVPEEKPAERITLGNWFDKFCKETIGTEASKTALARRYVEKCRDRIIGPLTEEQRQVIDPAIKGQATKVVEQIIKALGLPHLKATEVVLEEKPK